MPAGFFTGGTLFADLGFRYVGPIDGHDLDRLAAGAHARSARRRRTGPMLLHVVTAEGQGLCQPAEDAPPTSYHGVVNRFDVGSGVQAKVDAERRRPTRKRLRREPRSRAAEADDKASWPITAAMPTGNRARPVRRGLSRRAASTSASPSSTRSPSPPA
jgi:1-deoxy-D-xylulose-5-phosphate synthase